MPSPKPPPPIPAEPPATHEDDSGFVVVTLARATGAVLKVEASNGDGSAHELSAPELRAFGEPGPGASLEAIVESAFEAGIACVIGAFGEGETDDGSPDDDGSPESAEDADLRHLLLRSLIETSPARRLMRREVLGPAILGTLVGAAGAPSAAPD